MGFGADLRAICEAAKGDTSAVVRKVAVDMTGAMAAATPVDTGRLRANFQCGIGSINPAADAAPGTDPKPRALAALASWKPGQTIYITNSLPYAQTAEFGLYGDPPGSANGEKTAAGFSRQAPGGFVRLTVQRFEDFVAAAAASLK